MTADHIATNDRRTPFSTRKRPFAVTSLVVLVLCFTIPSWFGTVEILRHWDFLTGLPLNVPPQYLVVREVFWGLLGVLLIWGLWLGRYWAWRITQGAAFGYAAFYWFEKLTLAVPEAIASRWPFALGVTLLGLSYTFVVLWSQRYRFFFVSRIIEVGRIDELSKS
jgi:hypothetical protein